MSDEKALGQRELTAESQVSEFSPEELALVGTNAAQVLIEIVRATSKKTINTALGELSDFSANWLAELEAKKEAGTRTDEDGAAGTKDEDAGEDA